MALALPSSGSGQPPLTLPQALLPAPPAQLHAHHHHMVGAAGMIPTAPPPPHGVMPGLLPLGLGGAAAGGPGALLSPLGMGGGAGGVVRGLLPPSGGVPLGVGAPGPGGEVNEREAKKQKRKQSNRDSARRSRLRKQVRALLRASAPRPRLC